MAAWYYIKDGQQLGPADDTGLSRLVAAGRLLPNDLVWTEGLSDWVVASAVPSLFSVTGVVRPPLKSTELSAEAALQEAANAAAGHRAYRRALNTQAVRPNAKLPWVIAIIVVAVIALCVLILLFKEGAVRHAESLSTMTSNPEKVKGGPTANSTSARGDLGQEVIKAATEPRQSEYDERSREDANARAASNATKSQSQEQSSVDIVKSFNSFTTAFVKATNDEEPVEAVAVDGKRKFSLKIDKYGVDLRRTESLISPFLGLMQFTAPLRRDEKPVGTATFRLTFSFQSAKWVLVQIEVQALDGSRWYSDDKDLPVYARVLFTRAYNVATAP